LKKVLIVVYYWPPSGGSGVQRWLKFVKYLPQFGYEPHVYTVANGEFHSTDLSFEKDIPKECVVIKRPILEPFALYKKFIGKNDNKAVQANVIEQSSKGSFKDKVAVWIRGNFFIPDARVLWIKPSVEFLEDYIKKHEIETVITSGPPQSCYLIGLRLKSKLNIKWIADFRDPWTKIFYYDSLMLTRFADKKHKRLEKEVVTNADKVLTVGSQIKLELEQMYGREVDLITNGFDEQDFATHFEKDKIFTIVHTGTFFANTNPIGLWQALRELIDECKIGEFKFMFYGKVDPEILDSIDQYGLTPYLNFSDYVEHSKINSIQDYYCYLFLQIIQY
jgi:glycosyltransferase involved in cell wall biosynthesis